MQHITRGTAAAAIVAFILIGAGPATALPFPSPYIRPAFVPADLDNRPLERVDQQLVRGDDLTGAGVRAPSFIPVVESR